MLGGYSLGQGIGTLVGLIATFAVVFVILSFGIYMPEDLIDPIIVADFVDRPDLELKLAVIGTILYPPHLGIQLSFGAQGGTVLMALAWGIGGLLAGLLSRDIVGGVFAAVFAVVIGAFLTWLLVFFITTGDVYQLLGGPSLILLQFVLEGMLYPSIAAIIGGLLGGGITRKRS
ncbi:hypothetical protein EU520_01745 [Candidatus Thorarchaeota archaeon]|nr:MAG: hypothetical protein EU520_01745 [Candidatus Thorarchaeota archaeon]